MNEIYWITVLGNLQTAAFIISAVAIGIAILCVSVLLTTIDTYYVDEIDKLQSKQLKKITVSSLIVGFIMLMVVVFIPSKQDMYLIYGAGNVIDYCQDNPKVKELPDKAVEALNTWLDMVNEENTKQDDKERN